MHYRSVGNEFFINKYAQRNMPRVIRLDLQFHISYLDKIEKASNLQNSIYDVQFWHVAGCKGIPFS